MEKKVENLGRTSNDKMIAMKIAKFCRERSKSTLIKDSHLKCCLDLLIERGKRWSVRLTSRKL